MRLEPPSPYAVALIGLTLCLALAAPLTADVVETRQLSVRETAQRVLAPQTLASAGVPRADIAPAD